MTTAERQVPLGSMEPGETKSATIFYAAPYFAEILGGCIWQKRDRYQIVFFLKQAIS